MATSGQQRAGGYELLSLIRAGHACEIWKVRAVEDGRHLALKLLPPDAPNRKEETRHLKNEFAIGKSLIHDRVIRTEEFGSGRIGTFIVLELFPHPNLKQRINLGIDRLAYLVEDVIVGAADALGYLHQQGWAHCDVKPDNFLVDDDGRIKLIDFSLAKRIKGALGRLFSGKNKVQGTKSYMSPEQIRGHAVDARSDIYGLGCVTYEMLAGKPPFTGTNTNELLMKHLKARPPSLEAANKNLHQSFCQLVSRMLAKNPAERPASSTEFLDELRSMQIFKRTPERAESA